MDNYKSGSYNSPNAGGSYALGSGVSEDPLLSQAREMIGDPASTNHYKNKEYIVPSGNVGSDYARAGSVAQGLTRTGGCRKCNLYE